MRFPLFLAALLGCMNTACATSNNLTDVVTWDKYSLSVNGQRVFIKSVKNNHMLKLYFTDDLGPALPSSTTKDSPFLHCGLYVLPITVSLQPCTDSRSN
jgi:hypothetical protein